MKLPSPLLESIKEFERLLQKTPDVKESLPIFSTFIRHFIRTKDRNHSLPTIEIMTILRHEKPTVFYLMKLQSERDPLMQMITNVPIDLEKARQRLEELKQKLEEK